MKIRNAHPSQTSPHLKNSKGSYLEDIIPSNRPVLDPLYHHGSMHACLQTVMVPPSKPSLPPPHQASVGREDSQKLVKYLTELAENISRNNGAKKDVRLSVFVHVLLEQLPMEAIIQKQAGFR